MKAWPTACPPLSQLIAEGRETEPARTTPEGARPSAKRPRRREAAPGKATDVDLVLKAVEQAGYGKPKAEYRFHRSRKWRFDYAWPEYGIAFEREGGRFRKVRCKCGATRTVFVSRHHSRKGLEDDAEKYNAAQVEGWVVIRATPGMLADGRALAALLAALDPTRLV